MRPPVTRYCPLACGTNTRKLPSATGVPPLTPGTTQKMSHVIVEGFKTFEKEQRRFNIPRGEYMVDMFRFWFLLS
ncbi:protein c-ets-1-b-like isoform x1 [Plakobranchus ocellatus]|uniref:Protein c-ets-1-b-like isoform x1 n=1 Tax=Plakobranchus ocellatus TaxID=259542 RepID=A0AAV4AWA8_9GAST|nr:protein c-ets-1-b-like isoform x1 [Plakobranchus ocellatus]